MKRVVVNQMNLQEESSYSRIYFDAHSKNY